MTADFIVQHSVSRSIGEGSGRTTQWAKKTVQYVKRALRRIAYLYDFHLDSYEDI
jgi:hypothetical protein